MSSSIMLMALRLPGIMSIMALITLREAIILYSLQWHVPLQHTVHLIVTIVRSYFSRQVLLFDLKRRAMYTTMLTLKKENYPSDFFLTKCCLIYFHYIPIPKRGCHILKHRLCWIRPRIIYLICKSFCIFSRA